MIDDNWRYLEFELEDEEREPCPVCGELECVCDLIENEREEVVIRKGEEPCQHGQ